MAYFRDTTTTSEPTTDATSESEVSIPEKPDGEESNSSLLARMVEKAHQASTLLDPFINLLTLIVHSATVWALVRRS